MRDGCPEKKRVVVALRTGYQDQLDCFDGIMSWVIQNNCWDVKLVREKLDHDILRQSLAWGAQGMIVSNQLSQTALGILADTDIPMVTMDMRNSGPLKKRKTNIVEMITDPKAVAHMAATYFFSRVDYTNFAFVGANSELEWSVKREQAFCLELKNHERDCAVFTMTDKYSSPAEQHRLACWLNKLSKPSAIFAACDRSANEILDICHQQNIRVPEEIALLSVDNEIMICTKTQPTLTSIQPDFEGGGFQAAELLNRIMAEKISDRLKVLLQANRVVERGSTALCSSAGKMVQRACEFIQEKADQGIGVEDVVRHIKVSRSLADLRFRQIKGQSILSIIQAERLAHVTRLLRTTTLPIKEIGELCGFGTENYLKQRFKKTFGTTMREYRKNFIKNKNIRGISSLNQH